MSNRGFRGRKRRGRISRRLPPKPLVLIVCEGKKTEPEYFNEIRIKKRISKDRIKIITSKECGGTDPKTIVVCAKEKRKELAKIEGLIYDEVWCVFDHDDHDKLKEAIDQAKGNKFNTAFSNPCFELWCLLHFEMRTAFISRDELSKKICSDNCLPHYDKGIKKWFDILYANLPDATTRAISLRKFHRDNLNAENINPSTNVDELVSIINNLN
jgi:hypothetical protein